MRRENNRIKMPVNTMTLQKSKFYTVKQKNEKIFTHDFRWSHFFIHHTYIK